MVDKRLCMECKWFKPAVDFSDERCKKIYAECTSPRIKKTDNLIIGGKEAAIKYCAAQRSLDYVSCRLWSICGLEGRFYEPRE